MEEGCNLFERGAFEGAIPSLTDAARLYEKQGSPEDQCEALVKLSQAYQAIGEYNKALENLERALILSRQAGIQRVPPRFWVV